MLTTLHVLVVDDINGPGSGDECRRQMRLYVGLTRRQTCAVLDISPNEAENSVNENSVSGANQLTNFQLHRPT